jgi:mitogen-activated protein kinase kinase kinase 17/18
MNDQHLAGAEGRHAPDLTAAAESAGAGRYTMLQRLTSEPRADVHKALDSQTGRHVVMKVVDLRAYGPTAEAMRDEFAALMRLRHPHVVEVLECDVVPGAGRVRVVMEWIEGSPAASSVQDLLRRSGFRLHESVVRRYAVEALQGVAYLHAQGMVHRSVKPSNMLLAGAGGGSVKLRAFGVACKVTTSPPTILATGTPAYMSPESFADDDDSWSVYSDVWAWACSVVEMASGLPPWSELALPSLALVFRIGCAQPPNHHPTIPSHLSDELKALLMRCFAFDPAERPTAAELLATEYMLGAETVPAAPLPPSAEADALYTAELAAKRPSDNYNTRSS